MMKWFQFQSDLESLLSMHRSDILRVIRKTVDVVRARKQSLEISFLIEMTAVESPTTTKTTKT